jgi:hypothetical protein
MILNWTFLSSFFSELIVLQADLILSLSLLVSEESSVGYNHRKHLWAIVLVDCSKIIINPAITFICKDKYHVTVINICVKKQQMHKLFIQFINYIGQQNLNFFLSHEEKYLILIVLLTLNSNM